MHQISSIFQTILCIYYGTITHDDQIIFRLDLEDTFVITLTLKRHRISARCGANIRMTILLKDILLDKS